MRKMGWRDGQGVGPRITYEQRRRQSAELGLTLPEENDDLDDGTGEASKHYFAPLDRPLHIVGAISGSSDRGWGLGYKPGPTMEQSLGRLHATSDARPTFALDKDDEDNVYSDAMTFENKNDNRKIEIFDEDDDFRPAATRPDTKTAPVSSGRSCLVAPSRLIPSSSIEQTKSGGRQTFVDGSAILPGFELQSETLAGPPP